MLGAVYLPVSHVVCLMQWKAENAKIVSGSFLEYHTALFYLQS